MGKSCGCSGASGGEVADVGAKLPKGATVTAQATRKGIAAAAVPVGALGSDEAQLPGEFGVRGTLEGVVSGVVDLDAIQAGVREGGERGAIQWAAAAAASGVREHGRTARVVYERDSFGEGQARRARAQQR